MDVKKFVNMGKEVWFKYMQIDICLTKIKMVDHIVYFPFQKILV